MCRETFQSPVLRALFTNAASPIFLLLLLETSKKAAAPSHLLLSISMELLTKIETMLHQVRSPGHKFGVTMRPDTMSRRIHQRKHQPSANHTVPFSTEERPQAESKLTSGDSLVTAWAWQLEVDLVRNTFKDVAQITCYRYIWPLKAVGVLEANGPLRRADRRGS